MRIFKNRVTVSILILFLVIVGVGCIPYQAEEAKSNRTVSDYGLEERFWPAANIMPEKESVRGIYLNGQAMQMENVQEHIDFIKESDLNTVVMDVKDDFGKLTYPSQVDKAKEVDAVDDPPVKDMDKLLDKLKEAGIYTIARIVVFKDPHLAENDTDLALHDKSGDVWKDEAGTPWIDPYKQDVWQYVTDIAREAGSLGFDEIQYDYIRFPENARQVDKEVTYANKHDWSKTDNIEHFLKYSTKRLKDIPVYTSADVFGLVTSAEDGMGIGQVWEKISPHVDYISPMTYPSHYGDDMYGIANPNDRPYEIVKQAMEDAVKRNEQLDDAAVIRPWLQDFSLKRTYTEQDVRQQIKAAREQGLEQYLLWNASSDYTTLQNE